MKRESYPMKGLSVEELTKEAMELLSINLADLYTVLGFQLIGYSHPARLASIINYSASLQKILRSQMLYPSRAGASPLGDLSEGLEGIYAELQNEGVQFLDHVRGELSKVLSSTESLELADRATASSMQVMILVIAGALRMPPETESLAATIAAIICKSGLKEFCRTQPAKN